MRPSDKEIQTLLANVSTGASTAGSRGNPGVARAARGFFAHLQFGRITTNDERQFNAALDVATADLVASLPKEAHHWGIARKCVNVFLRNAFHNRFVFEPFIPCEPYGREPKKGQAGAGLLEM